MAISDNQKLDFLFKKLGFGATKTDTNALKAAVNEEIPSPLLLSGNNLWTDAAAIPGTKPTSSTDIVKVYQDAAGGANTVETNMLGTASTNRSWTTGLTDWIPPQFGSTYQIKVFVDNSGASDPESTGTQLFAAGSGNNDEWFFDYQSGVLNFIGTNLPSGLGGKRIYIVGARYIGKLGNRFTTLFVDSGVYEHTTVDSTDITMADIITAYIDSADIMHAIIDSADITLGKIATVTATNLTADSAHIKALSADSMSLSQLTANIVTANQIQGPANLVIDPAAIGDATGLVQILGNLQVEGTTTTINSTTVSLNDKNLVLADSSINAAAADGAGITVKLDQSGHVATILYKSTEDKWEVNKNFHVPNLNVDSADISLLKSDSAVITNAHITKLDADSSRLKIFQLDSGRIGKIQLIDSAKATNITVGTLTGDNIDVDSARFRRIDAQSFGITGTSPNRVLVADANNVVGTSINFVASSSQVNLYSSKIQLHNTGVIDVTDGVNVGSNTELTGEQVNTNNVTTKKIRITDMPVKRIPFTLNNDSLGTLEDLQFGQQASRYSSFDGISVGFNALLDSGNFRFSVDRTSGKVTGFGGMKIGRTNEIPTGQFIFNYPNRLSTDQQSAEPDMDADHNRPFYGLELLGESGGDSGQFRSTAYRNEFLSPVLQSVPSAGSKEVIVVRGLEESNLFRVFADGSIDFHGSLRNKGTPFAAGGIFDKDSDTQNARFLRRETTAILAANQFGFGFVDLNPTIGKEPVTAFVSRPEHQKAATHQTHSNVIQREKYNLSVNGTFAIRGDIDSSSTEYVLFPGAVYNWTNPTTGATNKVNYADDSDKSKMMYIPQKSIFRAGLLRDSSVRGTNMGMFSFGTGYEPIAKGYGAIAVGVANKALGNYAVAIGQGNDARSTLNINSIAIGTENLHDSNSASSQRTTLIGHQNVMRGNNSVVIGFDNNSPVNLGVDGIHLPGAGDNSVIIGTGNKLGIRPLSATSNGAASAVIGRQNELSNATAMYTMGQSNRFTVRASGSYSFGANAYIDAANALSLGTNNTITGPSGVAIGTKARVDSTGDFSIVVGLNDANDQKTGFPNIMSIQGGNLILGDSIDKFTASEYDAQGNLYVGGALIVAGPVLQENAPGVTSSTTPFVDDGLNVTSSLSGFPRRFGFNTTTPYTNIYADNAPAGIHIAGNVLIPGATGANGYSITPYPFTEDDQDPPQLNIPSVEQDSAFFDSVEGTNSMITYVPKGGVFRVGTFSGGNVYNTYLRPGRLGFQSVAIGKDNINAGLRTTVIGQNNDIQRGGGPKLITGSTVPENPGDSLNVASLRASDMIIIGNDNLYDSASTAKKVMIFGNNNLLKGAAENKILIGDFIRTQPNTTLSHSDRRFQYDKEIIMKHADSFGQDSLNNTHVSIGKFGVGFYGETQHGPPATLDIRGDIHLDSGSRILIGDPTSLTRHDGTVGLGVKELKLANLLKDASQSIASNPNRRGVQAQSIGGIGGGIASITALGGGGKILVTTTSNHGIPSEGTDSSYAVRITGTVADQGGTGNGVSGIEGQLLIPRRVDDTTFLLLQDSYRSFLDAANATAHFVNGVEGFDEDAVGKTITINGTGGTQGTLTRFHYRKPLLLEEPFNIGGDLTAAARGAFFRVDSQGMGFTATTDGGLINQVPMSYDFTNTGFNITGTGLSTVPINVNGTTLENYLDNTLTFAKLADITNIVDQAYVQARVSTDEFFVNHADALYFKPGTGVKTVQFGLDNTDTTSTEQSTYALSIKTLSGNGVINIKDPTNSINADNTSPIQINGANWPTDNYIKNIIDAPYIQSNISVSNATITNAIDEAYLSTIIDSGYIRHRVKDSDEWQTNEDGTVLHYGTFPNVANVKVGIGTATPRTKLEVAGHLRAGQTTFEGAQLIDGELQQDSSQFWTFDIDSGDIFLNDDANNINANTTILNTTQVQAAIAAAGTSDSDFTVDLGGQPDVRFMNVFKKPQGFGGVGDSVNLGTQANAGIGGIIPKHGGGTGHTINFGAWHFDPANTRFLKFKKTVFESDGSGNIIDVGLEIRDRRLNTNFILTGTHHNQGNGYDGNPLVFKVHPHLNVVERQKPDGAGGFRIVDSSVAGVSTSADGLTITVNRAAADLGMPLGDSMFTGDLFKITQQFNTQTSSLTVHGPTIFTSGGAADSNRGKSGLVTFQDSSRFNGLADFRSGVTLSDSVTVSQFTTSGTGAGGRGTPDGAGGKVNLDGYIIFDSNIAATIAPNPNVPGTTTTGFGGMGNTVAATVRTDGYSGQSGFIGPAETNPNHPLAAQNRFKMFREVRDMATKLVIDRRLMGFDSNVFTIIDSAYVGSKLNTDTQWNFGTDARQVSSLFYQGSGGVIIGGNQSSIQYNIGGGHVISDSDTKLQVNDGNVIFKQDTWDGIDQSTTYGEIPPMGTGSRFMWIPQRASLRAGAVEDGAGKAAGGQSMSATAWDDLHVGQASIAIGANADAKNYSTAIGYKTTAGKLTYSNTLNPLSPAVQFNYNKSVAIGYDVYNPSTYGTAIGSEIVMSGSQIRQYYATSIGYEITNSSRSDTVAIGKSINAFGGVAIGADTTRGNYANITRGVAIGVNASSSGTSTAVGVDVSATHGGVAFGNDGTSAGLSGIAFGKNSTSSTSGISFGATNSTGISGVTFGRNTSSGNSGVSVGRSTGGSTSSVSIGISNNAGYASTVALGISNDAGLSAVAIGKSNTGVSNSSVAIGINNHSLYASVVAVGIDNYDNSYGAVAIGRQNYGNSAQYTGGRTVVVGYNNYNNGRNGGQFGSGPAVVFGTDNYDNTSGYFYGRNNYNNNQVYIFGTDNNNITNGDFAHIYGTGATVMKVQSSASVSGGMQYGRNNTTYDNGYVYGNNNTGRDGGFAYGAGNYSYLQGYAFGYNNTLQGDSNPTSTTEYPLAFGRDNTVTNGGITFGENNTASGRGIVIGANSTSTGTRSLAIGSGMNVSGTNSIGIGLNNNFSGNLTNNNTFAITGGRVGIGTLAPSSQYIMEIDGGHLNVEGPYDYYRQGIRLHDYIRSDVINDAYVKSIADSDYIRTATTIGDHFNESFFFRRDNTSQNIQYTGNRKVGIGTPPRPVTGFQDPVLDVKGGINFEGGLFLSGTRIIPSIDSINAVYISHQTLEYHIGPDSATDFFDSSYTFNRISHQGTDGVRRAFGFAQLDSVQNVITPAYINARLDNSLFLDSGEALQLIDQRILEETPFRFNDATGQVQLTTAEISAAGMPNLHGGVKVGIGIAPDNSQTLRVGGDGTNAMEINNGLLKITGTNAKILIEKNGILNEISEVMFREDATTGNVRYDGGKNVGINLGAGVVATASLDVGGRINATVGLDIGGQDLLTQVITEPFLEAKLHNTFLDSALARQEFDSAYILFRADSAYIRTAADSDYVHSAANRTYIRSHADSDYIKSVELNVDEKLDFGDSTNFISRVSGGFLHIRHADSGQVLLQDFAKIIGKGITLEHRKPDNSAVSFLQTVDSGGTIVGNLNRISIPEVISGRFALTDPTSHGTTIDSGYVRFRADSAYIRTAIDSAYIKFRADSDYIKTAVDSDYIKLVADSDYIKTAVDSDHVDLITGIGQRDVDFNQRAIFYKNSVANTVGLPSASQNEGSVFVTRDNYKANVATNGNFEKIVHHRHTNDSDYILSVGRSTQLIAATSATTINQFTHNDSFKSAEYTIHLDDSSLNHSQISKILMTYNGNGRVLMTNYGIVSTMMNDSQLATFSADSDGTNILLKLTKTTGTGTVRAKIHRTIL